MKPVAENLPLRFFRLLALILFVFTSMGAFGQEGEGQPLWCAIWVSDTQNYEKGGGEGEYLVPLLDAVKKHEPKMILHTGDCIFRWGNKGAWKDILDVMRESDPPMELHVSPGNHDVDERDDLDSWITRAASMGIYPFDTGDIVPGKGYYKDRETVLVSGPEWPVWNPEVAAHPNWQPGEGGPYFYVFKRGGIRFIIQDYRNDSESARNRLCEELEKEDDSSVSILLQHKVRERWPHKEDCGGKHNLRLMLSGHYPGYSKGGPPSGVTHIRCASLANVHHGGENDIFLLWVYPDHLRLDRYLIPDGAPGDRVEGPEAVWEVDGTFTDYERPAYPKVPAVLEIQPDDGGWFTLHPGEAPDLEEITVRNLGGTESAVSLESSASWLTLSESSLTIPPYGEKKVLLSWDAAALKEGRQDAVIKAVDPKAYEAEVGVTMSAIIDTGPPDGPNLLKNPGAEEGMDYWTIGGNPEGWPQIDPPTHGPSPSAHSGDHRFGISWGWETGDAFQHQTVAVEAGKEYEAGFWVSKMNGTDESVEMLWIDGEFGGEEAVLYRTPDDERIDGWWKGHRGAHLGPSANRVTIVLRYRHTIATGIASVHVDDVYLARLEE